MRARYSIQTSANPSDGGQVICNPNPVDHGGSSLCLASANSGYRFSQWSGACSGASTSCSLTNITATRRITAQFIAEAASSYPIQTSASPSTGGSVTCAPNPVNAGGSSLCTATPASGYTFSQWSGDCSGAEASCTLSNVQAARQVIATFVVVDATAHSIETHTDPAAGGTVSCTPNPVPDGQNASCTATANSGYRFANWSGDCSGTTRPCTLSAVTRTQSLTAHFGLAGQPAATHAAPEKYVPGGLVTVTNHFSAPDGSGPISLIWRPQLPTGWQVVAVDGDGIPELDHNSGEITFLGSLQRPLELDFRYQISVPSGDRYPRTITAMMRYRDAQMSDFATLNVRPEILTLEDQPIVPHSADYELPLWRIDTTELSDVLLYWRQNAYHVDPSRRDGYNAGPGSTDGARHSADYQDPPWRIDSFEANRVIGYWRAGAYHVDPASDDGYAPGAQQTLATLNAGLAQPTRTDAPRVTQTADATTYTPGGTLTLTQSIGQRGDTAPVALLWAPTLPPGWEIIRESVSGQGGPELSTSGTEILLLASQLPQPLSFSYQVRIPATASGAQSLSASLTYQRPGMSNPLRVTANTLQLTTAGHCTRGELVINTSLTSGVRREAAETAIRTQGAVSVASGAGLELSAPRITLNPGFRVNAGARLSATSATVTCPAATQAAVQSTAAPAPVTAARAPRLIISADALPPWLTERLTQLGIDPEGMSTALLDAEERWLILATSQALHPADGNALSDVYRLDLLSDRLELISLTPAGAAGNGESRDPAADALGERVVFTSAASDLTPGDDNGLSDLFLRDLALGHTERLTHTEQASAHPALDAHGSALVYDQTTEAGPRQILGQALTDGAAADIVLLSDLAVDASRPALSADGRYLAYLSQTGGDCTLVLHDVEHPRHHRQPCPGTAAEADAGRVTFSPEGDTLLWHHSDQSQPLILANPLAEPRL